MSSDSGSRELIRELAEDLSPVRVLPPLRRVVLGVLGVWLAVAGLGVALLGLRPDLLDAAFPLRGQASVFAALLWAGLGGVVCGVALGIPGREALARGGLAAGLLGLALAAGLGSFQLASEPGIRAALAMGDLRCLGIACAVALLPALWVVGFAGRAAPMRPLALVLAAAAGTAALGAAAAQASCPSVDPQHLLAGHVLAPAAGVVVLTLPLFAVLTRLARD